MDILKQVTECVTSLEGRVAIATHDNPDADAIGSTIALERLLLQLGVDVTVIFQTKVNDCFAPLLGGNTVGKQQVGRMYFDTVFVLDCSAPQRLSIDVRSIAGRVVVVDHHVGFQEFGDLNWVVDVAATAVLVDQLITTVVELGLAKYTEFMATATFMALRGDTAGFRAQMTNADVLTLGARLLTLGADVDLVTEVEQADVAFVRLMGTTLNGVGVDRHTRTAYLTVDYSQIQSAGATVADASRLIDVLRDMRDVDVAYLFIKNHGKVFIKARSVTFDVAEVMHVYGGGGHKHAAGAVCSTDNMFVVRNNVLKLTQEIMDNRE